ncbi:hypothetical protein ACNKHN_00180 [Shigella flexneri]
MGAKSQLMAGFLYYFVAHACFTGIKRKKHHLTCLENACAARRLHEIKTSRKKWTKWSKIYIKTTKVEAETCKFWQL